MPILITPDNQVTSLAAALPIIQPIDATTRTLLPSMSSPDLRQLAAGIPGTRLNASTSNNTANLKQELAKKEKQIQLIQSAYWQLQSDFDNACNLIKSQSMTTPKPSTSTPGQQQQAIGDTPNGSNPYKKLNTINEGSSEDFDVEEYERNIKEKDDKIEELEAMYNDLQMELEEFKRKQRDTIDDIKKKNREINKKNNCLEREIKGLKQKNRSLEKQNKKLNNIHYNSNNREKIEKDTLKELYLNSNQIKKFMNSIKKYGEQYEILKKRQSNLTNCIGKEDNETFKIRMNDLYHDITKAEQSYNDLYESLDIIKTESQGMFEQDFL